MTRETTTSTRTPKRVTGTVSYEDQTISTRAIALLAGAQHASIDVHGAGQQGARLSLTWGTLLLGFTAADQVDALAEAFAESKAAARRIPSVLTRRFSVRRSGTRPTFRRSPSGSVRYPGAG